MDYLQNHIVCRESNWGGSYNCRHLVTIDCYGYEENEDWNNIIDEDAETVIDKFRYDMNKERYPDMDESRLILISSCEIPSLKPHVVEWLNSNVANRNDTDSPHGWAMGSAKYRNNNSFMFSIFFHRKNDAMAFIREFSKYKKPVNYCQYFTDVRKTLDVTTMKYSVTRPE